MRFQIKDKTKFEYNHDVVYLGTCPENNCSDNHVGESAHHISERIIDHSGRGQNSHPNTLRILVADLRAIIVDEKLQSINWLVSMKLLLK